jgi:hypothetical protein
VTDVEFQQRVKDMSQAINERTPDNWKCCLIIAETDSKRQSVICNLDPDRLLKVLEVVVKAVKASK